MRLSLLSNIVTDMLAQNLRHDIYIPAGHDTWQLELLASDSVFNTESFDAVFVILHCKDTKKSWSDYPDGESALGDWLKTVEAAAAKKPETHFFIANLDIAVDGIAPANMPQPERAWEHYWQSAINELMRKYPNIYLFDIKTLVEEHGRILFYSPKMWYAAGMPYSLKGLKAIANEIESLLGAVRRKKLLVTDLDNTLWGGVIGEDGIEGIELAEYKEGARFHDLQLRLKELARTGAVLAIASKNNPEDAYAAIDTHPHMPLRREDFVAAKINWGSKADSIRELAQELNLGLDSVVFLDDNPLEREIVKNELPQVTVADFPDDTALLEKTARDIYRRYFRALRVTDEDAQKTIMYRQEAERKTVEATAATPADYIRRLEMSVHIRRMTAKEIDRVVQLCNKTNQFNLTTKRYTLNEIIALAADSEAMILTLHSCDKFGDNGTIGVMIIKEKDSGAYIDTFLLSCRVMGRAIEDHAVAAVAGYYKSQGFKHLDAAFIRTAKNKPVERLYDRLGFEVKASGGERTDYVFNLDKAFPQSEEMYKEFTAEL